MHNVLYVKQIMYQALVTCNDNFAHTTLYMHVGQQPLTSARIVYCMCAHTSMSEEKYKSVNKIKSAANTNLIFHE